MKKKIFDFIVKIIKIILGFLGGIVFVVLMDSLRISI